MLGWLWFILIWCPSYWFYRVPYMQASLLRVLAWQWYSSSSFRGHDWQINPSASTAGFRSLTQAPALEKCKRILKFYCKVLENNLGTITIRVGYQYICLYTLNLVISDNLSKRSGTFYFFSRVLSSFYYCFALNLAILSLDNHFFPVYSSLFITVLL